MYVSYCLTQGGQGSFVVVEDAELIWEDGNIDANPLFVGDGDYTLAAGSPCIDAGDTTSWHQGWGAFDLVGTPRFLDDPDTPNTGLPHVNGSPIIDMGAYEYSPDCNSNDIPDWVEIADGAVNDCNENTIIDECEDPPFCPVDLDGNCSVGPGDVSVVKYHFGCDVSLPECAALDIDNNGAVGPGDVGYVKNLFGHCVSE